MSKKAADHHHKASEHHEKAAFHHAEAAKYHLTNAFEKAAHHTSLAQAHQHHATHHMGEALQAHLTDHGSGLGLSAEPVESTAASGREARSPLSAPREVKKPKIDVAADNVKGAAGKRSHNAIKK